MSDSQLRPIPRRFLKKKRRCETTANIFAAFQATGKTVPAERFPARFPARFPGRFPGRVPKATYFDTI
jgi:hypothetical protein